MQVFDESQREALLTRLVKLTDTGKLTWRQVSTSQFLFEAESGRFMYRISSRDEDDYAPYELGIFDSSSQAVSGPVEFIETAEFAPYNATLQLLYQGVKRKVLGLETVVSDVFSELNDL